MNDWKHPGSTLILPANAPKDEWLAARREGIGGSDVSAILGLNKYKSAYGVWLEKTGRSSGEIEESPAMRWGKLHEPAMRKVFTEDTGIAVRVTGLHRSKRWPHLQVTPDGLTADGGVFESKTANWRVYQEDWTEDEAADHASLQVVHSMAVTGRIGAHVMALSEGFKHRFYHIKRDEAMVVELADFLEGWYETYVIGDKEPPLNHVSLGEVKDHLSIAVYDKMHVGAEASQKLWGLLGQSEYLKGQAKNYTQQAEAIEAQIRAMVGESGEVVDLEDKTILTLRNDGTFSPKKFAALLTEDELEDVHSLKRVLDLDKVKAKFPKEYNQCRARVLRPKKEA